VNHPVALGLGLIGIGREWGFAGSGVPPEPVAFQLLERALELGIRYFDTAPSYGLSELRLGAFLKSNRPADLVIATKFGEHWDAARGEPYEDHSCEALCRSLDRSLQLLGRIDVVQLHKTTPEVLRRDDLPRTWEYARACGVKTLGASIKDAASAALALADPAYGLLQLPYNRDRADLAGVIDEAAAKGVLVAVNRPFDMGRMLYGDAPADKTEAFRFVLQHGFRGVILTGTKDPRHLEQNWQAFQSAS
jgi:aryl-alcohol dehydrogenase-like predicted oxidoreductase